MTTVTSDQLLVTSLEDNTIPVFEVYNPRTDQVDVVFLQILIYLLSRSGVFQKFLVMGRSSLGQTLWEVSALVLRHPPGVVGGVFTKQALRRVL